MATVMNGLERYWKTGPGAKKWIGTAHPWTNLEQHLAHHMEPDKAKRIAAQWFHDMYGYWPGDAKGKNPVGPG